MNERPSPADPLLEELASCLMRVREHIYRVNVGGLVVEAGRDLFGLTTSRSGEGPSGGVPEEVGSPADLCYPEEVEG